MDTIGHILNKMNIRREEYFTQPIVNSTVTSILYGTSYCAMVGKLLQVLTDHDYTTRTNNKANKVVSELGKELYTAEYKGLPEILIHRNQDQILKDMMKTIIDKVPIEKLTELFQTESIIAGNPTLQGQLARAKDSKDDYMVDKIQRVQQENTMEFKVSIRL